MTTSQATCEAADKIIFTPNDRVVPTCYTLNYSPSKAAEIIQEEVVATLEKRITDLEAQLKAEKKSCDHNQKKV